MKKARKKTKLDSFWCFALINNRLAEAVFEQGKIVGHCYVKASEYKTKQEKRWIKEDTLKNQLTFRNGVYKNKLTGKIMLQGIFPGLEELKEEDLFPLEEIAPGIIKDPRIHLSKPVIKGTRIPPDLVIGKLLGGMTAKEVMREYDLTKQHIEAAVAYGLRKGKLSQSKAAALLNIDRWDLVDFMAKYNVPTTQLTSAQLDAELKHWRRLRSKKQP